ncbi:MAG: carbamoyltransferase HypF [Candidatus Aceula meridiana]|nr:carbamoyltransferase HypF [Candidatus Aceula meridiana]
MKSRLRIFIRGAVQGVGFRPFIYKLAENLELQGWVLNSGQGVTIEAEGEQKTLEEFLLRIKKEKPALSSIQSMESSFLDVKGYQGFEIRESKGGEKTALILPDIATCPDCRAEILDSKNRRYRYPFANCTNCGPRYSIIKSLPYDRANTTMKNFKMCSDCQGEYDDPQNRRFHAQPNACAECGPHLELWDRNKKVLADCDAALLGCAQMIKDGKIAAVKGIGGFHLMADARSFDVVKRLRERKHREAKPFAVMYPSLEEIKKDCNVSVLEERLLTSPETPIVLLTKKEKTSVCEDVAPCNPYLGVMMPYTPLHILLMENLKFPVVATSGNITEETICIDEQEVAETLCGIADVFLMHSRPIARHVDDSIVRIIEGREMVLRRARGFAPLPIPCQGAGDMVLSVGPHLKNTVSLSRDNNIFVSQHIGDLETAKSFYTFEETIKDLGTLYDIRPKVVACDVHPDYLSTQFARKMGLPVIQVQHHYAHVLSCMAENEIEGEVLGVAWDGTGYGLDTTIWGGEFFKVDNKGFTRFAHFRPFPLPGGEKAIKEPRRSAMGLLYSIFKEKAFKLKNIKAYKGFDVKEFQDLRTMLRKKINSPLTSSVGRIFDAVASLTGLCQIMQFEGQAAMMLEFAAGLETTDKVYSFSIEKGESLLIDGPSIKEILVDIEKDFHASFICAKFHNTLVDIIAAIVKRSGMEKIVLTGGCFQNKYLLEHAIQRLRAQKLSVYWHQRIPPNDGGISLGQVVAAHKELKS